MKGLLDPSYSNITEINGEEEIIHDFDNKKVVEEVEE